MYGKEKIIHITSIHCIILINFYVTVTMIQCYITGPLVKENWSSRIQINNFAHGFPTGQSAASDQSGRGGAPHKHV